jgi:membrane protein
MFSALKWFARLLWKSFKLLKKNDPLILAASTAFFSTFAISPILVILVSILSFYFNDELIRQSLFEKIQGTFGSESGKEIQRIVQNLAAFEGNWWITIGGFLFLLFVGTTLLQVIRQSINLLWKIKRKKGRRFKITMIERVKAGLFLLVIGVLMVVSFLMDMVITFLHDRFEQLIPSIHNQIVLVISLVFSLIVVTASFTILFKLLPDGKASWRVAFFGGLLTGFLFNVGEWILGRLLVHSVAVNVFGASASFALILLFIFYCSFILYFGAAFTYVLGDEIDRHISAGKYGDRFEVKVVTGEEETEGPFTG